MLINLIGVLFLIATLVVGTKITNDRSMSLNISSKAADCFNECRQDSGRKKCNSQCGVNVNWKGENVVDTSNVDKKADPKDPTCDANGVQYSPGAVVMYGGIGSNATCGSDGKWDVGVGATIDIKPENVPEYAKGTDELKKAIEAEKQAAQQTTSTTSTTEQDNLDREKSQCLQEGGFWLNNACSYAEQQQAIATFAPIIQEQKTQAAEQQTTSTTSTNLEKTDEGFIRTTTTIVRDAAGKVVDTKSISTTAKTTSTFTQIGADLIRTDTTVTTDLATGKVVDTAKSQTTLKNSVAQPTTSITVNQQGTVSIKQPAGSVCTFSSDCESGGCANNTCQANSNPPPQSNVLKPIPKAIPIPVNLADKIMQLLTGEGGYTGVPIATLLDNTPTTNIFGLPSTVAQDAQNQEALQRKLTAGGIGATYSLTVLTGGLLAPIVAEIGLPATALVGMNALSAAIPAAATPAISALIVGGLTIGAVDCAINGGDSKFCKTAGDLAIMGYTGAPAEFTQMFNQGLTVWSDTASVISNIRRIPVLPNQAVSELSSGDDVLNMVWDDTNQAFVMEGNSMSVASNRLSQTVSETTIVENSLQFPRPNQTSVQLTNILDSVGINTGFPSITANLTANTQTDMLFAPTFDTASDNIVQNLPGDFKTGPNIVDVTGNVPPSTEITIPQEISNWWKTNIADEQGLLPPIRRFLNPTAPVSQPAGNIGIADSQNFYLVHDVASNSLPNNLLPLKSFISKVGDLINAGNYNEAMKLMGDAQVAKELGVEIDESGKTIFLSHDLTTRQMAPKEFSLISDRLSSTATQKPGVITPPDMGWMDLNDTGVPKPIALQREQAIVFLEEWIHELQSRDAVFHGLSEADLLRSVDPEKEVAVYLNSNLGIKLSEPFINRPGYDRVSLNVPAYDLNGNVIANQASPTQLTTPAQNQNIIVAWVQDLPFEWNGFRNSEGQFQFPVGRVSSVSEIPATSQITVVRPGSLVEFNPVVSQPTVGEAESAVSKLESVGGYDALKPLPPGGSEGKISFGLEAEVAKIEINGQYYSVKLGQESSYVQQTLFGQQTLIDKGITNFAPVTEVETPNGIYLVQRWVDGKDVFLDKQNITTQLRDAGVIIDDIRNNAIITDNGPVIIDFGNLYPASKTSPLDTGVNENMPPPTEITIPQKFTNWWDDTVVKPLGDVIFGNPMPKTLDTANIPTTTNVAAEIPKSSQISDWWTANIADEQGWLPWLRTPDVIAPIKPGEVFDPNIEVNKILTKTSAERPSTLADFKAKLAYQQKGMAEIQTSLGSTIAKNPEVAFSELTNQADTLSQKYGFADWQKSKLDEVLNLYEQRNAQISKAFLQYPDKNDLFEAMFGRKPLGRIKIERGPISIRIKIYNSEDYAYIYSYAFRAEFAVVDNSLIGSSTGGFFMPSATLLPDTEGLIVVENKTNLINNIFGVNTTAIHEDQHALNNLLQNADVYPTGKINFDSYYNLKVAIESKNEQQILSALQTELKSVKTRADSLIMDEVLAFLKGGTENKTIANILTKSKSKGGLYDFYGRRNESFLKDLFPEGTIHDEFILNAVDNVFGPVAQKTAIDNATGSFDTLLSKGYSRDEAIAALEKVPFAEWTKFADRAATPDVITKAISYFTGKIFTPTNLGIIKSPINIIAAGGTAYNIYQIGNFPWNDVISLIGDWWQNLLL